ncbi:MAG: hypothetical protein Q7K03_00690 [Dehalococcoidia bacterium]|nr:hypothetical protein [Dehalococcoidia bacterium]
MDDKHALELDWANHFMHWVTLGKFNLLEKPDDERPSRKGGHPDFRFEDDAKREYVLELTRLMKKELRNLEKFLLASVSRPIGNQLPGTYVLQIPVDAIGRNWIDPQVAQETVVEISQLVRSGTLGQAQKLRSGFVLTRVREDGGKLVVQLVAPELPYDLALNDPIAKDLGKEFRSIVQEADQKFQGYTGARVLLIGLAQSGLNHEFHAGRSKDGKGIMLMWADNEGKALRNIDYIYVEPGISVWQPGLSSGETLTLRNIFVGHRYTDSKAGHYVLLWQRTGTPGLLR